MTQSGNWNAPCGSLGRAVTEDHPRKGGIIIVESTTGITGGDAVLPTNDWLGNGEMQAPTLVIPAAGRGSRLADVCRGRAKCLLPVYGRPVLLHAMETGMQAPVGLIVIIVGQQGHQVRRVIGSHYKGVEVRYITQPEPLGLAHAVSLAEPLIDDAMIVVNGDEVYQDSRHRLAWSVFQDRRPEAVVGYIRTDDARRISIGYGLEIGSDKQVIRLAEKPSRPWNDLLGVGSWIVRHSWFDQFRRTKPDASRKERDFVTVIQRMIDSFGLVLGVDLGGTFFNINTSTDYFQMLAALRPSSNDMAIGIAAQ